MRTKTTPQDLEQIAADLSEISENLRDIVASMSEAGLSSLSLHSTTQLKRDVPSLLSWSYKIASDAKMQMRVLQNGRGSSKSNGVKKSSNGKKSNGSLSKKR
jgi:hypothetical protein